MFDRVLKTLLIKTTEPFMYLKPTNFRVDTRKNSQILDSWKKSAREKSQILKT